MSKKITKISLSPIKVLTPNGFSHGLVTKRPVTTREAKYIMRNIFGIDVNVLNLKKITMNITMD